MEGMVLQDLVISNQRSCFIVGLQGILRPMLVRRGKEHSTVSPQWSDRALQTMTQQLHGREFPELGRKAYCIGQLRTRTFRCRSRPVSVLKLKVRSIRLQLDWALTTDAKGGRRRSR